MLIGSIKNFDFSRCPRRYIVELGVLEEECTQAVVSDEWQKEVLPFLTKDMRFSEVLYLIGQA